MVMKRIDLRSDTVTLPTEEMMKAIESAELGDDVYEEDQTVNRLQELAAKKTGKEAALLVTSGTQANLVSQLALTQRGQEIIVERDCHMYYYEVGGMSAIAGLIPRTIEGTMGYLEPEKIEREIREKDIHYPPTGLICLENTHNRAGGTVITPKQMEAVHNLAKSHGLPLYVDGARIFNAAVALHTDVKNFRCDAMMFCLSKGLSAPIGSLICGSNEFIERARKLRKMLGGGMRQAGIIAACGIVAIEKMVDRLADDHRNAMILAEELNAMDGISVDMSRVQTNMVYFDVSGLGVKDFICEMSKRECFFHTEKAAS